MLRKCKLTAASKWDLRHLCRVPQALLWPLLFFLYGFTYAFNVLILWIHLCVFSSRPNVKIVLGASICLLFCSINRLSGAAIQAAKATLSSPCLWHFVVMPLWNVGLWTLCGAYAWTGFPFGVKVTPLWQFYLVCHQFVPTMETVHREEESQLFHRTSAPDVIPV